MLLEADVLPTQLASSLGAYKRIAPVFRQVVCREPTPQDAELVLRTMQRLHEQVAKDCWGVLQRVRPDEKLAARWTGAVTTLYFRTATIKDM